jgi:battenin
MLPLFIVFWAEYTINQGVAPVLLFPLDQTPFHRLREHYVYYQCMYQLGVFLSRSSLSVFPVKNIWALSLLQVGTLLALLTQALLFNILPSIYLVLAVIFWEGLLGGATYVNAFHQIVTKVPEAYREFSMGATALADTLGITLAAISAILIQPPLCQWQVDHGRQLCRQI